MQPTIVESFFPRWEKYFPGAALPIGYYYSDRIIEKDKKDTVNTDRCLIGNLNRVQEGHSFVYDAHSPGCSGGKRYSGFSRNLRPNFEYFLSCGIPGKLEGERYKKSPQLVETYLKIHPPFEAPGKYLVFKRLDKFTAGERPIAVIFFATPDVLAGLFALANYDRADPHGVICPMGSGCASVINYPLEEARAENPGCVLGMFDVSARPCISKEKLTFTIPIQRFEQIVQYMDESFLITKSWDQVRQRI
jgi:uncharacterized protein (DUF169 family)